MKTNIISINVKGLNIPEKRRKIFNKLREEKVDIICLQETHIKKKDYNLLKCPKLGNLFYSADTEKKKRGIALYVQPRVEAKFIKADLEGRILMVELKLESRTILLLAIYAPNKSQRDFFQKLYKDDTVRKYEHVLLMGDFNAVVCKQRDYMAEKKKKIRNTTKDLFSVGRRIVLNRYMERKTW